MEEPTDPDMFLSLFNIFMQFYKKTYSNSNDSHKYFFDKISDIADTNKPMELFYECITEYKASSYKEAESYDKDLLIKYESQYVLSIDDEFTFMSDNILSLIIEVAKLEPKIKFDIIELN
jgi:hypothetical protein